MLTLMNIVVTEETLSTKETLHRGKDGERGLVFSMVWTFICLVSLYYPPLGLVFFFKRELN